MTDLKIDFSDYKEGDEVWDSWAHKWVRIDAIKSDSTYSVRLIDGQCCNLQGNYHKSDSHPRYFPNSFEIPASAYERPLPKLAIDAPIWVKGCKPSCSRSASCKWKPANFKRFEQYGAEIMATVFADGRSSHTTDFTETYEFWSSTKPEEE